MNDNKKELIREAYRRGERRLESQLALALAADARALSFGGLMVAAAAILGAVAVDATVSAPLFTAALVLVIAAAIAMYSARPNGMYVPGGSLSQIRKEIDNDDDYFVALLEMAEQMEEYESENSAILKRNGRIVFTAYLVALLAVLAGFLVWICV